MKYLLLIGALIASPVAAETSNFTGPRLGATAGVDDVTGGIPDTTDVVYGVDAGIDIPISDNIVFGIEAFSTNPLEKERTIGTAARVGATLGGNFMLFGRAGYSNYKDVTSRKLDGLTVGGGAEVALNSKMYVKAEYRYSDFAEGIGNHGALVGAGLRF